jgi:hypothetical protein
MHLMPLTVFFLDTEACQHKLSANIYAAGVSFQAMGWIKLHSGMGEMA